MMVRLFVALDLSEELHDYLRELQSSLREIGVKRFRFVRDFHLTLLFLGETSEDGISRIIEALEGVSFGEIPLVIDGLGVFPDERDVRVVWVGLEEDPCLIRLQKDIDEALKFLSLPETDSFHPHLTLARVKFLSGQDRAALSGFLKQSTKRLSCTSKEFYLCKSTITSEGPVYERVRTFSG